MRVYIYIYIYIYTYTMPTNRHLCINTLYVTHANAYIVDSGSASPRRRCLYRAGAQHSGRRARMGSRKTRPPLTRPSGFGESSQCNAQVSSQTKGTRYGWGAAAPHTHRDFRGAAPLELPAGEALLHRKSGFLIYSMVGFTMAGFVRS